MGESFKKFVYYWDVLINLSIMALASLLVANNYALTPGRKSAVIMVVSVLTMYSTISWGRNTLINALIIIFGSLIIYSKPGELFKYPEQEVGNLIVTVLAIPIAFYIVSSLANKIKTAQKEAESNRTKLFTLIEGIGDGVTVIDPQWKITLWNTTAEEITGWTAKEAIGKHLTEVLKLINENTHEENYHFIIDAISLRKKTSLGEHIQVITKNGQTRSIGDSAAPIFNEDGELVEVVLVFRDTTEEKSSRLMHSDFAYASHQLRTPINRVMVAFDMIKSVRSLAQAKKILEEIEPSIESATKLTEDLVAVSEVENHMVIPEYSVISPAQILEESFEAAKRLPQYEKGSIEIEPTSIAEGIVTDAKILGRVLQELIQNALIYRTDKAKVLLKIVRDHNDYIFEVKAKTVPISDEEKTLIFTKFFRGSNKNYESIGTGLGLYLCKKYVEILGGSIWFRSDGNETTFYVAVPQAANNK